MEELIKVCDTCGNVGRKYLLALCKKCTDGAQHTYCMRVKLEKVPDYWTCEECTPRDVRRRKGRLSKTPLNLDDSMLKSGSSKLKMKAELGKAGCLKKQKVGRNPVSHDDRKGKGPKLVSDSMSLNSLISEKSNTSSKVLLADAYGLHNPTPCLLISDSGVNARKNGKETISSGDSLFSGSSFRNLDVVESSEKLDHKLQSDQNTHKDSDCPNINMKNRSQQVEDPIEVARVIIKDPAFDEWSRLIDTILIEEARPLHDHLKPDLHSSWTGRFQIHNIEGIARTCDGFQANLSTFCSVKILDFVNSLPEIIILEEIPRSRIWFSLFMGNQVTKEHIDLYFFAKDVNSYSTHRGLMDCMTNNDLALKANLDGADLLIFPSNVLPKESQCSSNSLFLWGVFKERKANNSTNSNTQISNALESANGDTKKYQSFNLNVLPEDVDDETVVAGILGSDSKSGRNAHVEESKKDMENTRYSQFAVPASFSDAPASASIAAPASASTAAPASVAPSNVHLHRTGQVEESEKDMKNTHYSQFATPASFSDAPASASTAALASVAAPKIPFRRTGQERKADSEKQIIQVNSKNEFTSGHMGDTLSGRVQTSLAKAERHMDRKVEATSYVASDYSLTKCVTALEEIQGISDDIYGKALKKFKDPDWREMFIAMSDDRKRGWLLRL
ncbi:uncharacterized protein LOC131652303 isoform X2 [Vicia villosa]|nr:uncharacterized protein LOC131652303 isoform X2 [Vicia villosa]XP_058778115.1 uncharacterized protein LOC131652303 isoform X2 [Vicia villosa]XP_058778116.1 uncharacterized protein LOC131652303 isoform X2 [Vicia villosa]